MRRHSNPALAAISRALIALFALAQVTPPGVAVAADSQGELTVVICTAHGSKTVPLSALTGETEAPAEPLNQACDACGATCRTAISAATNTYPASPPMLPPTHFSDPVETAPVAAYAARPPMPSRAPPHA